MNRHQVLTGACNSGDQCYSIGSVEGIHFTAYAAGCDIVILASDFQRVQIIPGVTRGNIKVSCIDCSTDTGKIVASYQRKVYIFEPTPLIHHESTHKLDYRWFQTGSFIAGCFINCLSWNLEGTKLLTGGEDIQIWQLSHDEVEKPQMRGNVSFHLGDANNDNEEGQALPAGISREEDNEGQETEHGRWESVWQTRPATPVYHLRFSPDGLLFASAGKADRLLKIWYEDNKVSLPMARSESQVGPKKEDLHYSFLYVAHPRAVTGFLWRKTSKYMPRGSVANMLVTSCKDNVCRLWCETILPDDGLIELEQFDPNAAQDPKYQTRRHKKRFMQRLKTIRQAIHKRRKISKLGPETIMGFGQFPSMLSVHDFHKFAIHQNGVTPGFHFHLAASINPETDIPLLPTVGGKTAAHNFRINWLNNKELQFTIEAEKILQELHKKSKFEETSKDEVDGLQNDVDSEDPEPSGHDEEQDANEVDETAGSNLPKKKHSGKFPFKKKHKHLHKSLGSHTDSQSSIAESGDSGETGTHDVTVAISDSIDRKIENLLRDWHQSSDMLFSIHPVDGSFLVWLVDWLDEFTPFSFRQAQVSFSSRLPNAYPIPDARSMSNHLLMYCNYSKMDIKSAMKISESKTSLDVGQNMSQQAAATGKNSPGQNDNMLIPNVLMVSKHTNGSLNQWQISFAEQSKFSSVVSIAHASRACGHRFRTNSAACHPLLPLLITTSHHNIPEADTPDNGPKSRGMPEESETNMEGGFSFCSELILWRVEPVGPLSKSGGIIELARINSPKVAAFSNVAWIPTLLPSTSLGCFSNSPSALFVASDGNSLHMYQAVIDARTLLVETGSPRKENLSFSSGSSSHVDAPKTAGDLFNIISQQSTARPGCVIELEAISDAKQNWQQTQLLHVFQEQLITGRVSPHSNTSANMEAMIDLRNIATFEENFYLVVLEQRLEGGSVMHMWKITISSHASDGPTPKMGSYVPDYSIVQEDDDENTTYPGSRPFTPDLGGLSSKSTTMFRLSISTTKVCSKRLPLPNHVDVICATVSSGHLSSASIYPACFAPYSIVTACSDGKVRFWQCNVVDITPDMQTSLSDELSSRRTSYELAIDSSSQNARPSATTSTELLTLDKKYHWTEWGMMNQLQGASAVSIPGKAITVSSAYSGRFAIAYRFGAIRTISDQPANKFINLCVAIYECESTGGSEWILEETIELKNINIPDPEEEIDLNMIFSPNGIQSFKLTIDSDSSPRSGMSPSSSLVNITRTKSIPSLSTIHSVRKSISEHGNRVGVLIQKHLVQLDWVSTEDGSHILTVGVGSKILLYSQVSNDIAQQAFQQKGPSKRENNPKRPMLSKSKSMVVDNYQSEISWMKIRTVDLTTSDGLPPLPMHISWVRGGILVVGMDNEVHVYSQWRIPMEVQTIIESNSVNLAEYNLPSVLSSSNLLANAKSVPNFKSSFSIPSFKQLNQGKSTASLPKKDGALSKSGSLTKSESTTSLSLISECGLFEASQQANPILPQYHPKQLMELLNFGKVKRVKAILAHLVRSISGNQTSQTVFRDEIDSEEGRVRAFHRQRTVSMTTSSPMDMVPDEDHLSYTEITSIPPLSIYSLLAADNDNSVFKADIIGATSPGAKASQDYTDLFTIGGNPDEDNDNAFNVLSSTSPDLKPPSPRNRFMSASMTLQNPNQFGPAQSVMLTKQLTHVHLPGLSSLDQMYLLALADTVASTKTDLADRFMETDTQKESHSVDEQSSNNQTTECMDDCGLRFLLAMRHHIYLLRTLPPRQRVLLKRQGLKNFNLVWAFHSESTEELLTLIPSIQKGEPSWEELKQFGAGWWINNINVLKRCIEKVAKSAFQAKKDPMDAALFYLAMKKKNVVWGLFRSVHDTRMATFFHNNFSEERWRKAALKNAFALLGRQRFMHAAAFFLLAGSLSDAIEVCIDKLNDIQLGMVLCRLFDGEDIMPDSVRRLFHRHILGCDDGGKTYKPSKAHSDPFLRSMALWLLKDYGSALSTLLQMGLGQGRLLEEADELDTYTASPSVFNFYNYLRTHPLIMRRNLASTARDKSMSKIVLAGFSHSNTTNVTDASVTYVEKITPIERRLFFTTAHMHFKNGCPLLALEVLAKLPTVIDFDKMEESVYEPSTINGENSDACIHSGTITNGDISSAAGWSKTLSTGLNDDGAFDKPVSSGVKDTASSIDLNQSALVDTKQTADSFDWGQPVTSKIRFDDEPRIFSLSSDTESDEELTDTKTKQSSSEPNDAKPVNDNVNEKGGDKAIKIDIMAQQYKFIACLKVMMGELSTLATGFEVDGGQLRYQLYIWLEKEVDTLQALCNYGQVDETGPDDEPTREPEDGLDPTCSFQRSLSTRSGSQSRPSLYEVILAEKMDLEAKLERMSKRKKWLKSNQQLLRTLLNYCVLQGASGGGLASVRMELLLLLQELQQERAQHQLLSPLPFPTTLPLLSASIASSKTVIADPIQHVQSLTQDILHTIIEFSTPPMLGTKLNTVFQMRNLSGALSACIYQCLCDSDSVIMPLTRNANGELEGLVSPNICNQGSTLMSGVNQRQQSLTGSSNSEAINTLPSKWPGVSSLRNLLARDKDVDSPNMNILLCESLVAVFVSLLVNGLATYDAHLLYRLVAHKLDQRVWSALFGGGVKTVLKVNNAMPKKRSVDDVSKQRMKVHMKLMGNSPHPSGEKDNKKTYKEKFVPPELSMMTYFMTKPFPSTFEWGFSYDSDESLSSDEDSDVEDDESYGMPASGMPSMMEHTDSNSYSWCLMRYAIVRQVLHNLQTFLPLVGIEMQELPVCSPLIHAVLKNCENWEEMLKGKLELFSGPPENYIPGLYQETMGGLPLSKYKALLDPTNTPFLRHNATLPLRRLWFQLLHEDYLKDIFLRYIFRKKKPIDPEGGMSSVDVEDGNSKLREPMKIIHKEQDIITAFAISQTNSQCLTLSTQKEIVELDIEAILNPPTWLEDETEYDIECLTGASSTQLAQESSDFLVVQTPIDHHIMGSSSPSTPQITSYSQGTTPATTTPIHAQSGRGSSVVKGLNVHPQSVQYILDRSQRLIKMILRRPVVGVRRIGSHPYLSHYLTGSTDGSVRMWEWGHHHALTVLRQPGNFPKVTKVLFNTQGNKCCVSDAEGSVCLWQVGIGSNFNKPILSLQCHNKTTSDFAFVGSSSLIATAGHSSENRNVCLWDTLLPTRSALVHAFQCHEHGSPAIMYAAQHQILISGGRKGEICIFDIRQRQMRHTFQAHESPIKSLTIDPEEEYFATGSAEGDIKVWSLDVHSLIHSFSGEHSKNTFFRNMGSAAGVTQVGVGPGNHLFSCGVDGSMKFRSLPDREVIVSHWAP